MSDVHPIMATETTNNNQISTDSLSVSPPCPYILFGNGDVVLQDSFSALLENAIEIVNVNSILLNFYTKATKLLVFIQSVVGILR